MLLSYSKLKSLRLSEAQFYTLTTLTLFVLIVLRNPAALFRAEFWAEDGIVFFKQAMEAPNAIFFSPLGGYQNLFPRIAAWLATFLPVVTTPYFYAFISILAGSCMLGFFVLSRFEWLIPQREIRFFLCCAFALGPDVDLSQSLCNMHPLSGFFAFLLVLDRTPFSVFKALVWFVLLTSTPEVPTLFPLLLTLFFLKREKKELLVMLTILLLTLSNASNSTQQVNPEYGFKIPEFSEMVRVFFDRFALHSFVLPILGPVLSTKLYQGPASSAVLSISLFFLFAFFVWAIRKTKLAWISLSLLVGSALYFVLLLATRFHLTNDLSREHAYLFWGIRYSYMAGCLTMLAWSIVFSHTFSSLKPLNKGIVSAFFIVATLQLLFSQPKPGGRPNLHWPEKAKEIQQALDNLSQTKEAIIHDILLQPNAYNRIDLILKAKE